MMLESLLAEEGRASSHGGVTRLSAAECSRRLGRKTRVPPLPSQLQSERVGTCVGRGSSVEWPRRGLREAGCLEVQQSGHAWGEETTLVPVERRMGESSPRDEDVPQSQIEPSSPQSSVATDKGIRRQLCGQSEAGRDQR